VLPILTYRLEVLLASEKELQDATRFHESMLQQLLSLPGNGAKPALYVLLGATPLEAIIHRKLLAMFGNVAWDSSSLEWDIAKRQV
jgi:hypothetical protein